MPQDTFRLSIASPSGGGKTNLLMHVLLSPLIFYDRIMLFGNNLEQEKYRILKKKKMNEITRQVGYDVLVCGNDNIISVKKFR